MSRYALNSALAGLALAVFVPLMAFAEDPFLRDFAYGPYDKGKKDGEWIEWDAAGNFANGPYVKGKKDGVWIEWDTAGNFAYGPYVDDKKHGQWIKRDAAGTVMERHYAHPFWVDLGWQVITPLFPGEGPFVKVKERPYDKGKKHGEGVEQDAPGIVKERPYDKGKKDGEWIEWDEDGKFANGPYVDGERHGMWFERFPLLVVDPKWIKLTGEMGTYEYEVRVR